MPMLAAESLAAWSEGIWTHKPRATVCGVDHDTRKLKAGTLYVALKGDRCDGHDFVGAALARGAVAALVDEAWVNTQAARDIGLAYLVVKDTSRALTDLAAGYRREHQAWVAGITGSMGKTTVKDMLADMLATVRETARTPGNWNNAVGLPLSLLAMSERARAGVFELGINHPGEMAPLCRLLQPKVGLVTTVSSVHIEFFKDEAAIADEKAALLRCLPVDGYAVLNQDDRWFEFLRRQTPCRVATVSMTGSEADYQGEVGRGEQAGGTIMDRSTGERHSFALRVPGRHAVLNATLAAAMARSAGVPWVGIVAALAAFRPLPMRWQTVDVDGIHWINDAYNANPVSMRAALQTLAEQASPHAAWLVLGDMRELGDNAEREHRALGAWLTRWPWRGLVAVGPMSAFMVEAAVDAGFDSASVLTCTDAAQAAAALSEHVKVGDSVLVKASRGMHLEETVQVWMNHVQGTGSLGRMR